MCMLDSLFKVVFQWITCKIPGIVWSDLGLAGPVVVYCD